MVGLEARGVCYSYFNGLVLRDVNVLVSPGDMVAIIGPNGSGKTTLLKLLSGVLQPRGGEVSLNGQSLLHLKRAVIARQVAVVPQQFSTPFAFTVTEVVMLGRIPFVKALAGEMPQDRQAATEAMETVGVTALAQRRFDELSGGERQKVVLAMALAQQPKGLLLDEPTVHLDISQQVFSLEVVRRLNREKGLTVVAAMHDLNLASLYFDRLVLLKQGSVFAEGTPSKVLTEETIGQVFGAPVRVETHPLTGGPHIVIVPGGNGHKKD